MAVRFKEVKEIHYHGSSDYLSCSVCGQCRKDIHVVIHETIILYNGRAYCATTMCPDCIKKHCPAPARLMLAYCER